MKGNNRTFRSNLRFARTKWGYLLPVAVKALKQIVERYGFSALLGELLYLEGGWYVTHSGLLGLAKRTRCAGIQVEPVPEFSDAVAGRYVFKATVLKTPRSCGFVGYGDADPSNVSSLVRGAEMRMAETRAVNRALRKAYGIGLCSVEELGSTAPVTSNHRESSSNGTNGHHNVQPRLRDRLCLLIRQHQLDATLVKAFAADYCGTAVLRDASREAVTRL